MLVSGFSLWGFSFLLYIGVLLLLQSMKSLASGFECPTGRNLRIITANASIGTPFRYKLQLNEKITSPLPPWMKFEPEKSREIYGFPFLDDVISEQIFKDKPFSESFVDIIATVTTETSESKRTCIKVRQGKPWKKFLGKSPIMAVAKLNVRRDILTDAKRRIMLWTGLKNHLSPNGKGNCGKTEELSFHLVNVDPNITRSLFVLARADQSKPGSTGQHEYPLFATVFVIWKIGCGFLDDQALALLSNLETRYTYSPVIDDWLRLNYSASPQAIIKDWIVGDFISIEKKTARPKRQIQSSPNYLNKYAPIITSRTAGAVSEGSGMIFPDIYSSQPTFNEEDGSKLRVMQPISPIEITVHQISNARIPSTTFFSLSGGSLKLSLFEHIYPMEFGLEFKDPSAAIGREIQKDTTQWVSFDASNEILRLRPYPEHVGGHKFVLCAYDELKHRACTPVSINVKAPTPIKKSFISQVSPGIFWCYKIPLYWFSELKLESLEEIDMVITSDSPFSLNQALGELCVITKLRIEQIMVFNLRGNNRALAQTVEVEFRLSVKVPTNENMVVSPRLRLRLRWAPDIDDGDVEGQKGYDMREITRLNNSLAQVLRIRVNPNISPQNIFVYDLLQMRNFVEKVKNDADNSLEIEFVYLPLGLPDSTLYETLSVLEDLENREPLSPSTEVLYTEMGKKNQLNYLLQHCEKSRLEGSVNAVHSATDSFRPFILEEVTLLEFKITLCSRVWALERKLNGDNNGFTIPSAYPLISSPDDRALLSGSMSLNPVSLSDRVIENFTVEAGLAFKKRITPEKVVSLTRIRTIEIIDENHVKVNDTGWIKVSEDNTNVFGLPMQSNIRPEAYTFWLKILTVDQRNPITIHFTVDVVQWPREISSLQQRVPSWPPFPSPEVIHNHLVRMRLNPRSTSSETPNENHPPYKSPVSQSPQNSLSYRWSLVTSIDQYLRPKCGRTCGVDIMLLGIQEQGQSMIQVNWAHLNILREGVKKWKSHSYRQRVLSAQNASSSSSPICPNRQVQAFQRQLLKVPPLIYPFSESNSIPFDGGVSQSLRQASWSTPASSFVEHLEREQLGTTTIIAIDLVDSCLSFQNELPFVRQNGTNASKGLNPILNFTTYIGETFQRHFMENSECLNSKIFNIRLVDKDLQELNETAWINFNPKKCAIFGIVLKSNVLAGFHEFRIVMGTAMSTVSRIFIEVVERNPRLPEVPNHRVLMRFEPGFSVRSDLRTHVLQTLHKRWEFLTTLDDYLRPECKFKQICADDIDILLISIETHESELHVIWAKKSLVYIPKNRAPDPWLPANKMLMSPGAFFGGNQISKAGSFPNGLGDAYPQTNEERPYNGKSRKRASIDGEHELTCPVTELLRLTQRLLGDFGSGIQPLSDLVLRFSSAGFGKLLKVEIEKMGPCSQIHLYKPDSKDNKLTEYPPLIDYISPPTYPDDYGIHTKSPLLQPHTPFPQLKHPDVVEGTDSSLKHQQQRAFLLTTLLPICSLIVILLLIVLAVIWFFKFRVKRSKRGTDSGDADNDVNCNDPRKPLALKEERFPMKKNGVSCTNQNISLNGQDELDGRCALPSKPLILSNEKPPLTPPELMLPMNKTQVDSASFQTRPQGPTMNVRPYYAMGPRPDPYRNLPPPIDSRFGLPRQMVPQYGRYQREPIV